MLVLLGHKIAQCNRPREANRILKKYDAETFAALAVSEVYELLRLSATSRQPVTAIYDGQPRLLCPHVGGRKQGRRNVFCYQFGGGSKSIESLLSGDKGVWRCLAVERLSQVELHSGAWHTEPRAKRESCIDEVDFDIDAQPEEDPQKGQ